MGHLFLALGEGEVGGSHCLAQDTYGSRFKVDSQLLRVVSGQQSLAQFLEEQNSETWACLTKHLNLQ